MQCSQQKKDGQQCQSQAMRSGRFCWLHDPTVPPETKRKAQSRGGRNNAVKAQSPLPTLQEATPRAVISMLVSTINEVRTGQIDIRIANCLGFLSGHLTRIYETSELEERLIKLEKDVTERLSAKHPRTP